METRDGCLQATPTVPGGSVTLRVQPGGLLIEPRGRADVTVRPFADDFPKQVLGSASGPALVRIPAGRSSMPWRAGVIFDAPVGLCEASGP